MRDSELGRFLQNHINAVEPLSREVNLAYWKASISGKPEDFETSAALQIALQRIYSDRDAFEKLRRWKTDGAIGDPVERRQVDLLHNSYLRNQIDPGLNETMTKLASTIENQFNVYRARIDGNAATSNDIVQILRDSRDPNLRRKAWEAGKEVGIIVEKDLLKLVKLRNEAAESLGYSNYYTMSLELNEQSEDEVLNVFDDLEARTRDPFRRLKDEMDDRLASRYGVDRDEIRPWHYEDPFFQEAPRVYDIDLDKYYAGANIAELVTKFYAGIGLDADDILARSDLYEKPGKDQHAFCTDIDRKGDIRILANIKSDEAWTGTMLHELGHAVHDKYVDPGLPYLLRQEAHIFTTEAVAMLFGRLSKNVEWISDMIGISMEERNRIATNLARSQRLHQLVFARWSQVMMRFERELYLDPDRNLNTLWWELVEDHQMVTSPPNTDFPHWASKTHIVSVPVYYHNYLLGELLASQLGHHIRSRILPEGARTSLVGQTEVGDYLKDNIFRPGARYRWDEMIDKATGESLSSQHFVEEFVRE